MTDKPNNQDDQTKEGFLYPQGRYYGKFTPQNLAFNANLQEFANRVSLICGLETGGKVDPQEAYTEIKKLWKQLKESKSQLLDEPPPEIEFPEE
ncbi:MAG TPA: DUF7219 family protein [Elainellaceae cyanobacterium]|jgi:hypothetical protein